MHTVKITMNPQERAADPLKQYFTYPVGVVLFPSNTSPDLFVQSPSGYGTYFLPVEIEEIDQNEYDRLLAEYNAEMDAKIAADNEVATVGDTRQVSEFDPSYILVQTDHEVASILESISGIGEDSLSTDDFPYLFVLIGEAEYLEVWGFEAIPYNSNFATLLYVA